MRNSFPNYYPSNRPGIYIFKHCRRPLIDPIRIDDRDAVAAEARTDRRALPFPEVAEIQIAYSPRRVDDRRRDAPVLGGGIDPGQRLALFPEELDPADRRQARRDAVDAVSDVRARAVGTAHVAREVTVCRSAPGAGVPVAEAAVLLVRFDLSLGPDDFVPLVDRPFEVRRGDPVVLEVDAHAVGEVDAHLHGIIRVDRIAREALLLPDGSERDRLRAIVAVKQVGPVRADVAERVARLGPLEGTGRDFERLFEYGQPVERLADPPAQLGADAQVVGVVALVHVDGDDQTFRVRGVDDPVGLLDR